MKDHLWIGLQKRISQTMKHLVRLPYLGFQKVIKKLISIWNDSFKKKTKIKIWQTHFQNLSILHIISSWENSDQNQIILFKLFIQQCSKWMKLKFRKILAQTNHYAISLPLLFNSIKTSKIFQDQSVQNLNKT